TGGDARAWIDAATGSLTRALELNPNLADEAYTNLSEANELLARLEMEARRAPTSYLDRARANLETGLRLKATSVPLLQRRALVELAAAQWAIETGRSPERPLAEAQGALARALEVNPRHAGLHLTQAELYRWRGEWRLATGGSPAAEARSGLEAVRRSLAINPSNARAVAMEGVLHLLAARDPAASDTVESAKAAAERLTRALTLNGFLKREYAQSLAGAHRLAGGLE
ncbi:MAG: hypothetical protein V1750_02885, partial [Acidobacteriota bacterium]